MDVLRLASLLPELPRERTRLLDNLGRVRREVGPITMELSDAVADHMNIRRGEVHEVVSFYSFLQVPTDAVRVCTGPVCDCFGARDLLESTPGAIEVACLGHCDLAPAMTRGDEIVPAVTHSTNDGPAVGLAARDTTLADYEARGGLSLLREVPSLERIVEELKTSGLTGYGGAGFPTGMKWEAVSREAGPRYVVVNADEGEPGTIKDRYVMELRPHLMLEATVLAMRVARCHRRATSISARSTHTARNRLLQGLDEFRAAGLLDGLSLELVVGAGAYIAGEETAMLESMEGRRAMPRLKPPFPSQVGYLGRPTLIQNVETLAHIPAILRNGGEWWAALGTREAKGTRLWSVTGAVGKPGCYEAPNGVTTRELVEEYAGGFSGRGRRCRPGRRRERDPSAGRARCAAHARRPARVRRWARARPPCRSSQSSYSPLRLLAETMRFFAEESCQKCTPCRIGNRALHHLAEELQHDRAAMTREKVDEWLLAMEKTSICGLGQASPFPVRNAMTNWPELFAPLGT